MREDPAAGVSGAVVLETRISFHAEGVEYTYRVRILSEAGRAAAQFAPFSSSAYDFEGRTVRRDGATVRFSEKKDFQSIEVESQSGDRTLTRLVAPGVTDDCVVELRWKERGSGLRGPLPWEYGLFHEWPLGHAYRTRQIVVDFPSSFAWAYAFSGNAFEPEVKGRRYTVRDLPPIEPVPFSLEATRNLPRLTVYRQPSSLVSAARKGEEEYWKTVGRFYKDSLGDVSRGGEFEAFAQGILEGLPETPHAKALALRDRLDARIVNTGAMTFAERANRSEKDDKARIEPADLGAAVRRGATTAHGMFLLYLHLAKQAGLKPTVALVTDRSKRVFQWKLLSNYQLDHYLVGVAESGRPVLWLDPTLRFGGGVIHPSHQGTPGLELDTDAWTLKPVRMPILPAAFNVREFTYELQLGEDEDAFTAKARFGGYPDYVERRQFMALEPKEQSRSLKERLEKELKTATITRAEVAGAQSADRNMTWEAEGRMEVEASRRRTVGLFPAMPRVVTVPPALPETRTLPIVLPYPCVQVARTRVSIPSGYHLVTGDGVDHSNTVGSVSLSLREAGPGRAEAVLRIELTSTMLRPEAYGELKEFLTWSEAASRRSVILER
jgi:hypothetical protein